MPSNTVICTIFENNYEYGLGSFLNSVFKVGFKGDVFIGYKDALPFWISQLSKMDDYYYINSDIRILFKEINYNNHLSYFKPNLISALSGQFPNSKIFYFDPDITLIADWLYFEQWIEYGICLCLDQSYAIMPKNHPLKSSWKLLFSPLLNGRVINDNDYYINSGFIGIKNDHINLIQDWQNFTSYLEENQHNLKKFGPTQNIFMLKNRLNSICGDQDILNAALIYSKHELSIFGQEGMGFIPSGYLMAHNTGKKSWNKFFLKEFLIYGNRFSDIDQSYFNNSAYPIKIYSKVNYLKKRIDIILTKLFQRIL